MLFAILIEWYFFVTLHLEKISQQAASEKTISSAFQEIKNDIEELNTVLNSYLKKIEL